MDTIYNKISLSEKDNKNLAVATIIKVTGSTPRKSGTKMIIFENGETYGTIGGGSLEKKVISDAINIIGKNKSEIFDHQLEEDLSMGCGGNVQVFIEPIIAKKELIIFGAGHIGKILAKFANQLNFKITLVDNREDILNKIKENNYTIVEENFRTYLPKINFNKNIFISVVTHNHDYDKEIVAYCAKKEFAYLGMIGSKTKIKKFREYYLKENILNNEDMSKIDWPMGIDIECQTPEEITISILAKLIDVRAKL
ncbi:MAG: XdhC family protein [Bacteroidales bacterium]|nr:XdhC family protein [Bacteroidales bacterium]